MKFRKRLALALVLLGLIVIFFVLYLIMGDSLTHSSVIGTVWFIAMGITLVVGFISELISLFNRYR